MQNEKVTISTAETLAKEKKDTKLKEMLVEYKEKKELKKPVKKVVLQIRNRMENILVNNK